MESTQSFCTHENGNVTWFIQKQSQKLKLGRSASKAWGSTWAICTFSLRPFLGRAGHWLMDHRDRRRKMIDTKVCMMTHGMPLNLSTKEVGRLMNLEPAWTAE